MGRKTSSYMRKRMAQGKVIDGQPMFRPNAWLAQIKHSTEYNDDSIAGEEPTAKIADRVMDEANAAYANIAHGLVGPSETDSHDMLAHCIGMAQIRIIDIGGPLAKEVIEDLNESATALLRARYRWQETGKWGFDGPALNSIRNAIDTYEVILRSSSPGQMEHAQITRLDKLNQTQKEAA